VQAVIRFNCPTCRLALQISDARASHELGCPGCGRALLVPLPQPPEAGPATGTPLGAPSLSDPAPSLADPAAPARPGPVSRWSVLFGAAGVAAAGCLVALLCAGRHPGADGLVAQIVRHPWWETPPSRADVGALARAVAGAPPGAAVYVDGAGKPFRPVVNPRLVKPPVNVFNFSGGGESFCDLLQHPDGRPLGRVRHCCVEIPRPQAGVPEGEWELGLILHALDDAGAGLPEVLSKETGAPGAESWTPEAVPAPAAYRAQPQAPLPGL
jgi:hypothetical protein